jgi:plasmid maintenance system antidote protein VapI
MARTPIHPGEILKDELDELGISAAELWMNLQQAYELDLARRQLGAVIDRLPTRPATAAAEAG